MEDFSKINGEGTLLRRAQLRVLDIYIEVDKICSKHNIDCWLTAGSLLGAVRHGGFIPWDDDIDLSVQFKDLKRLSLLLQKELPKQFVVQDYSTDKNYYIDSVLKVRDTNSRAEVVYYAPFKEQGLFLDIIAMENIPSMKFKKFVLKFNKHPYLRRKEISFHGKSKNIIGLFLAPFSSILIRFAHWYSSKSTTKNYGYNYIFWMDRFFEMQFNRDMIFPLKKMKFEGIEFSVPNNPHECLKETYGDYMKIPSPDKRKSHATHIEFYD